MSIEATEGVSPLAEFDPDVRDVIGDGYRTERLGEGPSLPDRMVMTLLGPVATEWVQKNGFEVAARVNLVTSEYPIWVGDFEGERLAVTEVPVGGPAAVIVMEEAIMRGATRIVATGCAGVLVPHEVGTMMVPTRALRDEGTSHHYLPTSRWVDTSPEVVAACVAAVREAGLPVHEIATWTTDALFRETPGKVAARREEGCAAVEMECASFAAVARFRGVEFGQILFGADTLADENHDIRGWGNDYRQAALAVALKAAAKL